MVQQDIDEVFAQGAKPGDAPIRSTVVPLDAKGIERQRVFDLVLSYQPGDIADARTDELFNALVVLLGFRDVGNPESLSTPATMMQRMTGFLKRGNR